MKGEVKHKQLKPELTTISATALQRQVGRILRETYREHKHFIVERDGFPVVAILPLSYYERFLSQQNLGQMTQVDPHPVTPEQADKT